MDADGYYYDQPRSPITTRPAVEEPDFEQVDEDHSESDAQWETSFDSFGKQKAPTDDQYRISRGAHLSNTPALAWASTRSKAIAMDAASDDYPQDWQQAGQDADAQDLAGPGSHGKLECTVTKPTKEMEGTQNQFISYLVTTHVSRPLPHSVPPLGSCHVQVEALLIWYSCRLTSSHSNAPTR